MRDTGETVKVYEVGIIEEKSYCPSCDTVEDDRIIIAADERYCYCFACGLEWIIHASATWEPDSHWDDHPDHSARDWRAEVEAGDTRHSYVEWVNSCLELRDDD